MSIPPEYYINDIRDIKTFKKTTFSNHIVSEVINLFKKSIKNKKIEECCYWSIELFCSGYIDKIYEIMMLHYCKNINVCNPIIIYKLYKYYNFYLKKIDENNYNSIINNKIIRENLSELCILICVSKEEKQYTLPKISIDELKVDELTKKLQCNNYNNILKFSKYGDSSELKIVMAEFNNSINNKLFNSACYWLCWINFFEKLYLKKNKEYECGYREVSNIETKYRKDYIWFVWDIILFNVNSENEVYIKAIYQLYKYKFAKSKKNKRLPLIICCLKLLVENIPSQDKDYNSIVSIVNSKINLLYKEIKNNEIIKLDDALINSNMIHTHNTNLKFNLINEIDNLY